MIDAATYDAADNGSGSTSSDWLSSLQGYVTPVTSLASSALGVYESWTRQPSQPAKNLNTGVVPPIAKTTPTPSAAASQPGFMSKYGIWLIGGVVAIGGVALFFFTRKK